MGAWRTGSGAWRRGFEMPSFEASLLHVKMSPQTRPDQRSRLQFHMIFTG